MSVKDKPTIVRTFSLSQAAIFLGISRVTLSDWVTQQGCPADKDENGHDWQVALSKVFRWRINKAVQDAVAGYQDDRGNISKVEADRRRAVALAITSEVDADQALGIVIGREEVESDVAGFCSLLRSGLSNAAMKVASRAAAMNNAAEIQYLAETEFNRAYDAAAAELNARWSADEPVTKTEEIASVPESAA